MPYFPQDKLPKPPKDHRNPLPTQEPAVQVENKIPSAPEMGPEWAGPFWPAVATYLFKAEQADPASFPNVERVIRGQPIEWGALFDAKGKAKVVLTANSSNSIPIMPELVQIMRGMGGTAIFTHNHPQSSSFSMDDVNLFVGCGMREIRVVSERYVYSLSDPTFAFHQATVDLKTWRHMPGWDLAGIQKQFNDEIKSEDFKRMSIESDLDGKARMLAMVLGTPMEYEKHLLVSDMINRRLFTMWGLTYNVVHVEEMVVANPLNKKVVEAEEVDDMQGVEMEAANGKRRVSPAKPDEYELNDHDSTSKLRDHIHKEYDKDPLKKQICNKVDEFNKCKEPRRRNQLRKEIEVIDKVRREKELEKLR